LYQSWFFLIYPYLIFSWKTAMITKERWRQRRRRQGPVWMALNWKDRDSHIARGRQGGVGCLSHNFERSTSPWMACIIPPGGTLWFTMQWLGAHQSQSHSPHIPYSCSLYPSCLGKWFLLSIWIMCTWYLS
jgi:hypothetical protein